MKTAQLDSVACVNTSSNRWAKLECQLFWSIQADLDQKTSEKRSEQKLVSRLRVRCEDLTELEHDAFFEPTILPFFWNFKFHTKSKIGKLTETGPALQSFQSFPPFTVTEIQRVNPPQLLTHLELSGTVQVGSLIGWAISGPHLKPFSRAPCIWTDHLSEGKGHRMPQREPRWDHRTTSTPCTELLWIHDTGYKCYKHFFAMCNQCPNHMEQWSFCIQICAPFHYWIQDLRKSNKFNDSTLRSLNHISWHFSPETGMQACVSVLLLDPNECWQCFVPVAWHLVCYLHPNPP